MKLDNYRELSKEEDKALLKYSDQFKYQDVNQQLQQVVNKIHRQVIQKVDTSEFLFFTDFYNLGCQEQKCQIVMEYTNLRNNEGNTVFRSKENKEIDREIHSHYFLVDYKVNKYNPIIESMQEIDKDDQKLINFNTDNKK